MKIPNIILSIISAILVLGLLYIVFSIFLMSSEMPWNFYNNTVRPAGNVSKNRLVSYDNFEIKSNFVDSVELNKFTFTRKNVPLYDAQSKEYFDHEEIENSSLKIGTLSIHNTGEGPSYEYPDMTACIENKAGDLVYGLNICMNNCDNNMNSTVDIPANQTLSLEMVASLDGFSYYKEGGVSEVNSYSPLVLGVGASGSNLTEDFSTKNLTQINIYPRTYSKSAKGDMPYGCSDFYKNRSTPLKVIMLK